MAATAERLADVFQALTEGEATEGVMRCWQESWNQMCSRLMKWRNEPQNLAFEVTKR